MLPNSTDIIVALNRIIKAFESPIEVEVTKTRWEEIKKLRIQTPESILSCR
jgi:SpoVK/Ycf46/Vps4 family AAA+-type ATPase